MLTSQDRRFITDVIIQHTAGLTTKEEFVATTKGLVTKEDLVAATKGLATKEEFVATTKGLATKEDLAVTKKDLQWEIEKLAAMTHNEFETVHASMGKIDKKLDVLSAASQEHDYYIRKLRVETDKLKQRTGLTD